jgi:hypothetical protein
MQQSLEDAEPNTAEAVNGRNASPVPSVVSSALLPLSLPQLAHADDGRRINQDLAGEAPTTMPGHTVDASAGGIVDKAISSSTNISTDDASPIPALDAEKRAIATQVDMADVEPARHAPAATERQSVEAASSSSTSSQLSSPPAARDSPPPPLDLAPQTHQHPSAKVESLRVDKGAAHTASPRGKGRTSPDFKDVDDAAPTEEDERVSGAADDENDASQSARPRDDAGSDGALGSDDSASDVDELTIAAAEALQRLASESPAVHSSTTESSSASLYQASLLPQHALITDPVYDADDNVAEDPPDHTDAETASSGLRSVPDLDDIAPASGSANDYASDNSGFDPDELANVTALSYDTYAAEVSRQNLVHESDEEEDDDDDGDHEQEDEDDGIDEMTSHPVINVDDHAAEELSNHANAESVSSSQSSVADLDDMAPIPNSANDYASDDSGFDPDELANVTAASLDTYVAELSRRDLPPNNVDDNVDEDDDAKEAEEEEDGAIDDPATHPIFSADDRTAADPPNHADAESMSSSSGLSSVADPDDMTPATAGAHDDDISDDSGFDRDELATVTALLYDIYTAEVSRCNSAPNNDDDMVNDDTEEMEEENEEEEEEDEEEEEEEEEEQEEYGSSINNLALPLPPKEQTTGGLPPTASARTTSSQPCANRDVTLAFPTTTTTASSAHQSWALLPRRRKNLADQQRIDAGLCHAAERQTTAFCPLTWPRRFGYHCTRWAAVATTMPAAEAMRTTMTLMMLAAPCPIPLATAPPTRHL